MQKKHVPKHFLRKGNALPKEIRMMKLTELQFFMGISSVFSSPSYSQGRISVRLVEASLPELFFQIKQQSDWRIFYKDELVQRQKVTLEVKDKNIQEVLDLALANTGLTYRILRKQVAIVPLNAFATEAALPVQQDSGWLIKGRIFDTHEPPQGIPGVTVRIKDSNQGTLADTDGYFTIRARKNDVLLFSLMGYHPQEVTVTRPVNRLTVSL